MESIVKVEGVSKHYGSVQALDDVSFEVRPGEIFGLIGPDGAGKSTLFRMLATLLCPESGRITVDGLDVVGDYRKLRACVGYMPGRFSPVSRPDGGGEPELFCHAVRYVRT